MGDPNPELVEKCAEAVEDEFDAAYIDGRTELILPEKLCRVAALAALRIAGEWAADVASEQCDEATDRAAAAIRKEFGVE